MANDAEDFRDAFLFVDVAALVAPRVLFAALARVRVRGAAADIANDMLALSIWTKDAVCCARCEVVHRDGFQLVACAANSPKNHQILSSQKAKRKQNSKKG